MITLDLTPEETEILKPIENRFSEDAKFAITLESLVDSWERFVNEISGGYDIDEQEEYSNDLSARNLIQEICDSMPVSIEEKYRRPWSHWITNLKKLLLKIAKGFFELNIITTEFQKIGQSVVLN